LSESATLSAEEFGARLTRCDDCPFERGEVPCPPETVAFLMRIEREGARTLRKQENKLRQAQHELRELRVEVERSEVRVATLEGLQKANEIEVGKELRARLALVREVQERTVELKAAKEAADAANKAKSDFLASMSHDLRTPLNGILGYAQILERAPELSAKSRDGITTIRRSGEHLLMLINDLLDLAKIEAGKMDLAPSDVHLPSLVRTVADMCRGRAELKKISFAHHQHGMALESVYVDEKRLMQVLLNLLGNAIKFTEQGGVSFHVDVLSERPSALDSGANTHAVHFRIQDTGPGIAPEHLAHIFEPFEQVGSRKARSEGTGLGLAISKKIVEQMGGSLTVQSQPGRGSVFEVILRLSRGASITAPSETPSWDEIVGYQGERRSILVVDDSLDNRAVLRDMLEPIGFKLFEAENGEQGLGLCAECKPALILMDLGMPGIDGFETTRRIRQMPEFSRTVIVASSASVSDAEQHKSITAGCNGFLPKPVQAGQLLENLQKHLGLEWIRRERQKPAALSTARDEVVEEALVPPPVDAISRLLELADRGRMGDLLEEAHRIEQMDLRHSPWIDHVRTLAKSFKRKELRHLLYAHIGAKDEDGRTRP
jgi:signal transduction histidine kinase/CheY-like chemotaxis protein